MVSSNAEVSCEPEVSDAVSSEIEVIRPTIHMYNGPGKQLEGLHDFMFNE